MRTELRRRAGMSDQSAVAITGANGYVGQALCAAFTSSGYRVIGLQRSVPAGAAQRDHIPYSLEKGLAGPLPVNVAAVVHCAYDLRARDRVAIERINLGGTDRLLAAIAPIPVIYISSMSAYPGTKQIYGQTKLACEDAVSAYGG